MVKVFKKSGSKNYYFQIVVDGRRVVESTRTKVLRDAMKRAEERIMELKLKLDYSFYLKKMRLSQLLFQNLYLQENISFQT